MCLYTLVARRCSDGSLKSLVSLLTNDLDEFSDFLNSHLSVIPEKYFSDEFQLYYDVCDPDADFDEE